MQGYDRFQVFSKKAAVGRAHVATVELGKFMPDRVPLQVVEGISLPTI
jgi:hypothetical protein